jgi:uncharacterized protein DUF3592
MGAKRMPVVDLEGTGLAKVALVPRKKPNRFAAFVNSPQVVAWFLILVALGCGLGAVAAHSAAAALRDHGQRVVGEVVEVHDVRRDSYVVVRFRDIRGADVTADVGNYRWDPQPQIGDKPELLYDPDDPTGNVADVRMGPDFFTVWALVAGSLVAGGLVWPTWTGRLDWDRLRR